MTTFDEEAYLLKVTAYLQSDSAVATTTTFYPAATVGRSTAPTDTPATTYVPAAFTGTLNYALELFSGADPSAGPGRSSLGVLELVDPDGSLDSLTNYVWDGATVDLLRGAPTAAFSTYSTVAKLAAAGMVWDTRKKQIQLRALDHVLTAPLHDTRFAGTGGYEGDVILAGVIRPICYGQAFNISPVQINAATLVYQVSCTSVQAIAVRDGGVARPIDTAIGTAGNFSDYATLVAATIAAGKYATCNALGLFRLNDVPLYGITCDVQGDADTIGSVAYTAKRAGIIRRIAIGRGNLKLTVAQLDDATFTAMDAAQTGVCGFYFDKEITKAAAISEVAAGCLGYWWFTVAGLFSVDYLTEVEASADYTLTVPAIGQTAGTGDVIGEPALQLFTPPRQATFLGVRFNNTIQQQSELAGSVSQEDVALYAIDMRKLGSESAIRAHINPTAPIVILNSGFSDLPADAQAEATRQQTLLGVPRVRWSVKVRLDPFGDWLNKTFSVNGWTRFGFAGAKRFLCVGVSVQGRNEVVLDLWGTL